MTTYKKKITLRYSVAYNPKIKKYSLIVTKIVANFDTKKEAEKWAKAFNREVARRAIGKV